MLSLLWNDEPQEFVMNPETLAHGLSTSRGLAASDDVLASSDFGNDTLRLNNFIPLRVEEDNKTKVL